MTDSADLQLDWLRLSRKRDPATSHAAAKRIAPRLSKLQEQVLYAVMNHPNSTAEQLEQLPQFLTYAPSTVRKRLTDLHRKGLIQSVGVRENSRGCPMQVWRKA